MKIKGERERRGGHESPKRAPCTKFKVGHIWAPRDGRHSELDPLLARARKGAERGDKDRQIVRFSTKPKPNLTEIFTIDRRIAQALQFISGTITVQ